MSDLDPEVLFDQLAQRIGAERGVIVDFRDSGLVAADAGEAVGDNLSAKPMARLEDRYVACSAGLGRKVPCREQAAGTTADNGNAELPNPRNIASG